MADPTIQPKARVPLAVWITALAAAPILAVWGTSLLAVDQRLSGENGRSDRAQLSRVAPVVQREVEVEGERLQRLGAVIARDPKFFAVLTLPKSDRKSAEFKAALENVLREFQRDAGTPLFAVTGEDGTLLARASAPATGAANLAGAKFVKETLAGRSGLGYVVENGACYRVAAVPVTAGATTVGVLCVGSRLDSPLADRIKTATGCETAFLADRKIAATSIPPSPLRKFLSERVEDWSRVGAAMPSGGAPDPEEWTTGGTDYLAIGAKLDGPSAGGDVAYVLLKSAGSGGTTYAALRHDVLMSGAAGLALALAAGALISAVVFRRRRRMEAEHAREVERLEETDRVRSGFLATAAREVLAPIGNIRTYVELIGDGALGDLTDPQREGLLAIRRSADAVTRAGCDLANMSLIDRRELPVVPDEGDVGRLVDDVAIHVVPLASERRQRLAITVEGKLTHPRVDVDCLAQAVLNLAVNAVRHTPEGGSVEMGARRTDRSIEIFVSDTGTGVSAEDQDHIKERSAAGADPTSGYRATTYRSPGLGLGLSVAYGIVEAHGGTIRVDTETEQGSVFTIELPLPRKEPLAADFSAAAPSPLQPPTQDALPLAS
jgi:signal transduction histidine kinase